MGNDKTIRKSGKYFGLELSRNWDYALCGIDLYTRHSYKNIGFSINIPYVISLYLKFKIPFNFKGDEKHLIKLAFHYHTFWWNIYVNQNEWDSKTPKWRQGSFNIFDFLCGKPIFSETIIEERDILIPMPEKSYPAKAKLSLCEWKRSRWFTKKIKRCDFTLSEGIPHAGKGENSWDCEDDATMGFCTSAEDIFIGVGKLVTSCLKTRVRYGGWKDYKWEL